MVPPVRALIFDMDGTIVDNMRWHALAWQELFRDEGVEVPEEQFFLTAGKKTDEIIHVFLGPEVPPDECIVLAREKEFLYRYLYRPHREPVAGLESLLGSARVQGVKLGVATSAEPKNIRFILDGLNLRERFDQVVGADQIKRGKPEPDVFLRTAELLGVSPAECIVFEDAKLGFEAAQRAGMRSVGLTTDLSRLEISALPGVVQAIDAFDEFNLNAYLEKP